jgi:hypothetical protein
VSPSERWIAKDVLSGSGSESGGPRAVGALDDECVGAVIDLIGEGAHGLAGEEQADEVRSILVFPVVVVENTDWGVRGERVLEDVELEFGGQVVKIGVGSTWELPGWSIHCEKWWMQNIAEKISEGCVHSGARNARSSGGSGHVTAASLPCSTFLPLNTPAPSDPRQLDFHIAR